MEGYSYEFSFMVRLILSLIVCPYVCGNLFKEVSSCPSSEEEWRHRSEKKQCKEPIPDFMCAAVENQPGRFGEICTVVGLTGKGKCVVLDADTYNLNFVECFATSGCPPNAYISFDLYKYPVCYKYNRETTTLTSTTGAEQDEQVTSTNPENTERDGSVHAIAFSTFTVFLCILFVFLMLLMKKRSKQKKDLENNEADEPTFLLNADSKLEALCNQKISILGGYMKFQLVKLSKVKNLRFHMVTHSESLKLHFKGNFDRMNSGTVDWTKFDLDTVYTLLSNFCGITCPDRGWGYKPTDEDLSVGADIERIRILVNEYMDSKMFNVEEADQIIERWNWLKKGVDSRGIIDFDLETKINYKKLNPNNIVEHGTVVTRVISNILEKLKSKKIVTCRGAIGCGKTTALEYVARKYRNDGWTTKWIEEFVDESFFNNVIESNTEKIMICCDNLFGSFGCQVFSDKMFYNFHYFMHSIHKNENNIKVLLGIHEHVIEEISSKHSFVSQDYNAFVEMDSLSQSEALLIYIKQQEKSNIKQEYIPFEDFLELNKIRSANVGAPFQTLMISAAPGVFGTKAFCNQPFQLLTEHVTELLYDNEEMFFSLLYVMCVVVFDKREGYLKEGIANAISPRLDKKTIEHYLPELGPYIQNDDNTVKIKHEVISIALFHTFMMQSNKPWSIFSFCDIRRILELIRPDDQLNKLHHFAVSLSEEKLYEARKIIKTKNFHNEVDIRGHPVWEKFSKHKTNIFQRIKESVLT
ncbi:uncharacterized protein LOC128187391 [Crassostrea angulata]|uniref:uncharacterized protein LOC128187391 n=1 Tax=Magallana angulata TaxID=2784310 RepID=UPI0022B0BABA|nr:uncharacterized protein LOC128187391 [Crassostrea angulata]